MIAVEVVESSDEIVVSFVVVSSELLVPILFESDIVDVVVSCAQIERAMIKTAKKHSARDIDFDVDMLIIVFIGGLFFRSFLFVFLL